jgi:DNA-binding NarL/FixJ family response regulator
LTTARALGMRALEERLASLLTPTVPAPVAVPISTMLPIPDEFSQRELEVPPLLAAGKSNRGIADAWFIILNTVTTHVRNILTKTGCTNRTEAAAYALRHGLLPSP